MKCEEELDEEDGLDDEEENPIILGEIMRIAGNLFILLEEEVVNKWNLRAGDSIDFFEYLELYDSTEVGSLEHQINSRIRNLSFSSDDDLLWLIRDRWKVCIYPGPSNPFYRQKIGNPDHGPASQYNPYGSLIYDRQRRQFIKMEEGRLVFLKEDDIGVQIRPVKHKAHGQFWDDKDRPAWWPIGRSTLDPIGNYSLLLEIPSSVVEIMQLDEGSVIGCQWNDWRKGSFLYLVTKDRAQCPLEKKTRDGLVREDACPKLCVTDGDRGT